MMKKNYLFLLGALIFGALTASTSSFANGSGIFYLINLEHGGRIDADPNNSLSLGSGDGSDRKWELIYDGDGEYFLECQSSSRRYLTERNGNIEWDENGSTVNNDDRWIIIPVGNNYKLKNRDSGRYLIVENNELQMAEDDNGDEAIWQFSCATETCVNVPIEGGAGIFNIKSLSQGGNIDANPNNGLSLNSGDGSDKRWELIHRGNDVYLIESKSGGRRYLTDKNGTPEWDEYGSSTSSSDRWELISSNGNYKLRNVGSGDYLKRSGNDVTMSGSDSGNDVVWVLNCATGTCIEPTPEIIIGDGIFNIINVGNNGVIDADPSNGISLGSGSGDDRSWEMIHDGDGQYLLECQFSGRRYLTQNGGFAEWDGDGSGVSDVDRWAFEASGSTFKIKNVSSGEYLRRSGVDVVLSSNSLGDDARWTFNCTSGDCTLPGGGVVTPPPTIGSEDWVLLLGPEQEIKGDDIEIIDNSGGDVLVDCDGTRGHVAKNFAPVSLPAEITFNWRSTFDQNSSEPADGDLRGTGDFRISVVGVPSGESHEELHEGNLGMFEGIQFRVFPHLDESDEREWTYEDPEDPEPHTATSIWVRYTDPDRLTGYNNEPHTGLQSDACQGRNRTNLETGERETHNCGWDRHDIQGGGFDIEYNETMPMRIYVSETTAYIEANGRRFEISPDEVRFDQLSAIVIGLTNTSRGYETFEISNLQATHVGSGSRQDEGTEAIMEQTELAIYPVPTSKTLYVNRANDVNTVEIFNAAGQLVLSQSNLSAAQMAINVEPLKSGIYTVRVHLTNDQVETHRIIKE